MKCKCSEVPAVMLIKVGKRTKLPIKHFSAISSKRHPGNPFHIEGGPTYVSLIQCDGCGQLWQIDSWSRSRTGYTSYPQICMKIHTRDGWECFDDHAVREKYFPEMENGLSGETCVSSGCNDIAIVGLSTCANCTCRERYG